MIGYILGPFNEFTLSWKKKKSATKFILYFNTNGDVLDLRNRFAVFRNGSHETYKISF